MQDRVSGGSGTPSLAVVVAVIASLFAINSVLYVIAMHVIYIPLLRNMGYQTSELPSFVRRFMASTQAQVGVQ